MDIGVRNGDKIRLTNLNDTNKTTFIDITAIRESDENFAVDGIGVAFYSRLSKVFIIKKEGDIKVFVFGKDDTVQNKDFGWWKNGEIIWSNLNTDLKQVK